MSHARCSYGSSCRYAHGEHELRERPAPHPLYKTAPCINMTLFGQCKYGRKCAFSHNVSLPSDLTTEVGFFVPFGFYIALLGIIIILLVPDVMYM